MVATVLVLVALSGWTVAVAELSDTGPLSAGGPSLAGAVPTVSLPTRVPTATPTVRPTLTPAATPTPRDGDPLTEIDATATAEAELTQAPTPTLTAVGSVGPTTPTTTALRATPSTTSPASAPAPSATPTPTTPPLPTTTSTPTPTPAPPFVEHVVQPGESLSAIASEHGASVEVIATANRLPVDGSVQPGQRLFIPRVAGVVHTVGEGDSVSMIGDYYGVPRASIVEVNQLTDAGLIFVGQRLLVPGGRPPTPTATANPPTVTLTPVSPTATLPPATPTAAATATPTATPQATRPPTSTVAPRPTGSAGVNAPLRWPAAGGLSQRFGENGHSGIDIMANMGDAVSAAADGLVILVVDSDFGYGKRIEIDHGNGLSTLYAHLSAFAVGAGQRVSGGQRIGSVGDTGYSFGPHLHFEVRIIGNPADPLRYLP